VRHSTKVTQPFSSEVMHLGGIITRRMEKQISVSVVKRGAARALRHPQRFLRRKGPRRAISGANANPDITSPGPRSAEVRQQPRVHTLPPLLIKLRELGRRIPTRWWNTRGRYWVFRGVGPAIPNKLWNNLAREMHDGRLPGETTTLVPPLPRSVWLVNPLRPIRSLGEHIVAPFD
jgi:hypothetical protein